MLFWITATILTIFIAAMLVLVLLRSSDAQRAEREDIRIYRDQLLEIDRDLKRAVISEGQAQRLETEVQRRILDADRISQDATVGKAPSRSASVAMALGVVAVIFGASFGLYNLLGAPLYPDMPLAQRFEAAEEARKSRPSQVQAEAEVGPTGVATTPAQTELLAKLRRAMTQRPDDLQGLIVLAMNEAAAQNFAQARMAQQRVIALKGDNATAADYVDLADMMILAAGGYVSPEAEDVLTQALRRDATNGTARYYSGLLFLQTGRPDIGFAFWRSLLEESTPDAPWYPLIAEKIESVAYLVGVEYTLPDPVELVGPTVTDIETASRMSSSERNALIGTMVAELADRLAREGGSPEEWARLITSFKVLEEDTRARDIWSEAQKVFAGRDGDLARIRIAAQKAGLLE